MRLRLSRRAIRDLAAISAYIREHNPSAALRVRDAIYDALHLIVAHPRAGRLQAGTLRKYALPRYPYLIFYEVDEARDVIGVATIRHAAREL